MRRRAIVWVNWGTSQANLLRRSIKSAEEHLNADLFVITDTEMQLSESVVSIPHSFISEGFARKAEALSQAVPPGYTSYLFLDADTVVLDDITLGFEQAEQFGVAVAAAPTYLLDEYHRTAEILISEGIECRGQLLFNSGVIFFSNTTLKSGLFEKWLALTNTYGAIMRGDQELLTIALLLMNVNPYVLSKSYNTRGRFEVLIGKSRIWHQRSEVPRGINEYDKPYPPRILARGRITDLRLKDTYGGWIRYFRLNIGSVASAKLIPGFLRELFRGRRWT